MDNAFGAASGRLEVDTVVDVLRRASARFGYLHGSHVSGAASPRSDVDVAAWFGSTQIDAIDIAADLPRGVDLLMLDTAPLELAGRVALHGQLLFDDDASARVAWEATTRKIYLDERPRIERARSTFARAWRRG